MKKILLKILRRLELLLGDPPNQNQSVTSKENCDVLSHYVIDASITGIEGLRDQIQSILESDAIIILTTITITELEKLQCTNDVQGNDANFILSLAAKDAKNFECITIDETLGTPDDCIVKYCADHADEVILLTADRTMALKARAYDVETQYLQHHFNAQKEATNNRMYTLYSAKKIAGKLVITLHTHDYRSIWLLSGEDQFKRGTHELKVGDDIYIATRKPDFMTFAHYRILSLESENNSELIFSYRIYEKKDIKEMPLASYKTFLREFWSY